jgi:hypothetical protein
MMGRQTGDQTQLFYLFNLEERIPANHLLRWINPIVTGVRSAAAARTLRAAGLTQISVLRRGMEQWNEAGLPVEGRAVKATGQ